MIDINPPSINVQWDSSMPLRVPGWQELPLGTFSAASFESEWLNGSESLATAPAGVSGQKALLFVIDGKPLMVTLQASIEERASGQSAAELSTPGQLDMVKTRLGISVTQLADLLGVTRKAVYDWYEGAAPRPTMIGRINSLADALGSFDDTDLKKLKAVWNITLPSGSFRSTLQSDTLSGPDLTAALVAKLNELSAEMSATTRSSRRASAYVGESSLSDIDRRSDSF
ncbi:hypothetical protein [Paraburkholderia aromaticivorans]|uniref:Uncharacterized protein n=1 Tax=Paraburkholderia aromaticivorans TaxID=2026199 RepID=A0A248VGP8_9BURK|nr:hypothetical protein [Paraburkholderia aromaticivorans]ASV97589.1 hypothetical protein CJU94_05070 [Paraburkholderia aromaticivorans]